MGVADGRGLAFGALDFGPGDAFDGVVRDGVAIAQVFKQRGQGGQFRSNGGAGEPSAHQLLAPGDDVRARNHPKFLRPHHAREAHELADRLLVHAPRAGAVEVREPFGFGGHVLELLELLGC